MTLLTRLSSTVAAGILTAALLTSCSSTPALTDGASAELQSAVTAVANPAAAGDPAAALAALDTLQATLDAHIGAGSVTAERAAQIQANIDQVRADLQAIQSGSTPTPAPVETPEPEPTPEETSTEEEAPEEEVPAEEEPTEPATPAPVAPAPSKPAPSPSAPAPTTKPNPGNNGNGNGNSGNNGNNGNGNGNSGNDDSEDDDDSVDEGAGPAGTSTKVAPDAVPEDAE